MRTHARRRAVGYVCAALVVVAAGHVARAQGPQAVHETVVVTGSSHPSTFDTVTRAVRVITRDELERLPVATVIEALRTLGAVDVRARGARGAQADFSLRGAGFGQALVLIDGVRLNNSQTGHHNGDLPVPIEAIERIEVLLGAGAALYGADAVGGTINIVTRAGRQPWRAGVGVGQHALIDGSVDGGVSRGRWTQQVSFGATRTDGFMFDRDESILVARTRASLGTTTSVGIAVADKAFGANGFYGNSPSKEWTQQVLVDGRQTLHARGTTRVTARAAYRTHRDHFQWDVTRPGVAENKHRTHAASGGIDLQARTRRGWLVGAGVEHAADWIRSTNLGDHDEHRTGGYVDAQAALGTRAHTSLGLRVDRYETFGTAWTPSLGAGAWVSGTVRVRGALTRSFRAPTFTERYYRDPAHEASADLAPERAWAGDAAIDWVPHPEWIGTLTLFARREHDVIDWVKATVADRWRTRNIRRVDTRGAEVSLKRALGTGAYVSIDYAFTDVVPDALTLLSKYTLDYARHGVAVTASGVAWRGIGLGTTLAFRQRTGRDAYLLADVRVSRRAGPVTVFVDVKNLFDQAYEEVRGIAMPGRWATAGVRVGR